MKIAIVTGASGNLGQAVVNKMLIEDYIVIGTVIPNATAAINIENKNFRKIPVDLGDENASSRFIASIIDEYKAIDVLVATVGGFAMGTIAETSTAEISGQYKLNFETSYNVVRPCFEQMMAQKNGRIFLVGSRPGMEPKHATGMVAYSLAKSLIFHLAKLLNAEAKGTNVITSVLVPGIIDTPQNRKSMPGADFSNWVKPDAIAEVIHFYCDDNASSLREPVIKLYNNS